MFLYKEPIDNSLLRVGSKVAVTISRNKFEGHNQVIKLGEGIVTKISKTRVYILIEGRIKPTTFEFKKSLTLQKYVEQYGELYTVYPTKEYYARMLKAEKEYHFEKKFNDEKGGKYKQATLAILNNHADKIELSDYTEIWKILKKYSRYEF